MVGVLILGEYRSYPIVLLSSLQPGLTEPYDEAQMKPKVKIVIVLFFATVVTLLFFWPDVFFALR